MDAEKLARLVTDTLDDGKAHETRLLDVRALTAITDFMVITSGRSPRQVRALAQRVIEAALAHGVRPIGTEGENAWEWVLVDFGDVIVHVMQPQTRSFYQLEKLWEIPPAQARVV